MLNVVILSMIMLGVVMLIVFTQSVDMLRGLMLGVTYAECHLC
jgi:hypothetical protein